MPASTDQPELAVQLAETPADDDQRAEARDVARGVLAVMAEAIRRDVDENDRDGPDRLLLADVFDAAVPYVGDPRVRPLVLPLAKLAQRMYRAAMSGEETP